MENSVSPVPATPPVTQQPASPSPAPQLDKIPATLSVGLFAAMLVCLILAMVPLIGTLLAPVVLAYVIMLRRRAVQSWNSQARITDERSQAFAERDEAREVANRENAHKAWLEEELHRIGGMDLVERDREKARLAGEISRLEEEIQIGQEAAEADNARSRTEVSREKQRLKDIQAEIVDLKDMADLNDYGLYNFETPADDSILVKAELDEVRGQIKQMIKDKTAASGSTEWTVSDSKARGRKMVNDMTKLMLRAFNAEVENSIKAVRAGHLSAGRKRVEKSAEQVEKLGKMLSIRINPHYLILRLRELSLTHKHLEAVKAAKEQEKEARALAREEAKAQKELLAAKAKQEKEIEHRRNVLAQLQAQAGSEELSEEVAQEVAKAAAALSEAETELEDVESTMANTRAGYVYVASNRGAFGSEVVKIGMTRRLNPEERLKELSDASVPFNFDKHTIIFSEDARGLENALHVHFAGRRVNLINMRREYFYATPFEVKEALLEHDVHVLEYHEEAEAPEYLASEKLRAEKAPRTELA